MDKNETFYDILKVPRNASISEIVAAYHSARGAFSKDSIAMYSLFSQEEAAKILRELEEAYLTLSNIETKREYDQLLNSGGLLKSDVSISKITDPTSPPFTPLPIGKEPFPPLSTDEATDPQITRPEMISGALLKSIRERRSLSIEDVARITKIPQRFLHAIEEEDAKKLPAKVYTQGFIKNLAALYKLDAEITSHYFTHLIEMKKTGT